MKILEAFGEPIADGGQEAFVFGVMKKMDMIDMEIDCLTAYDCKNNHYKSLVESKGGKVYSLNLPFAPGKSRNNIKTPFAAFMRQHTYDVVHIHSGSISVLAIMASVADKAGASKVIVHSHASGDRDSVKHKVLRYVASLSMRRHVDVYCACSKSAAEWKFEPKFAAMTQIIKNGIDLRRFQYDSEKRMKMRQKLGLSENFVIGHVGRFTKEKNHKFLVDVFESLSQKKSDAHLLLVGDGDDMETIRRQVKRKRLVEKVTFTGSVTNVEDYLQAMDVFVLPSLFEGLGIVAIEAQCSGLPVIISDKVPQDIAVSDGVTFLKLEENMERWVQQIQQNISVYSKRKDNIEQLTRAGYDIISTARQIKELYRS